MLKNWSAVWRDDSDEDGDGGRFKDEKADLSDIEIVFPNISTKLNNDRTFNNIYVDCFKSGGLI